MFEVFTSYKIKGDQNPLIMDIGNNEFHRFRDKLTVLSQI